MSGSVMTRLALGAAAVAILAAPLAVPVLAKDSKAKEKQANAAVLNNLLACKSLPDAQRLACYDQAVDAFDQAQQSGAVVVVDKQGIREAKRDVFGFNVPTFGKLFDRGGKVEDVNEVTLTIDSAQQDALGKWIFHMEGGQIWHSIESEDMARRPHKGSQVLIRHGAVGSYTAKIDGQPTIKVHRDE